VLDEGAEQPPVDLREGEARIQDHRGARHAGSALLR
jgi:hypothetical protein